MTRKDYIAIADMSGVLDQQVTVTLSLHDLVEIRERLLDSAAYWAHHGNEHAYEKAIELRQLVHSFIVNRPSE